MQLQDNIIESTVEIFTTMVMMEIKAETDKPPRKGALKDSISGIIGLAGSHKGILAIHFPKKIAFEITANFLGMEFDEITEDVEDAIGEIANMLGGNIKSCLSENGNDIDLSLPSTISGQEYDFQINHNAELYAVTFSTSSGTFSVELQLESS